MTALVIDASVAVKWFVTEPDSPRAQHLLSSVPTLLAPEIILAEAGGALSRLVRTGQLPLASGVAAVHDIRRYFTELAPLDPLIDEAFATSISLRHPLPDCFYLVLSRRRGVPLITADGEFLRKVAGTADAARMFDLASWS